MSREKRIGFEQLVEWTSQEDILTATAELERVQTLQERIEVIGQLISNEENYNYAIKQTLILVDFYQQHPEMRGSELTQRVNGWYRQGVAELLGVTDPAIAQSIISFIGGLIIERLTGNQSISFTEQMALFGKMLTAYLEQQVEEQPNHRFPSTKRGKKP